MSAINNIVEGGDFLDVGDNLQITVNNNCGTTESSSDAALNLPSKDMLRTSVWWHYIIIHNDAKNYLPANQFLHTSELEKKRKSTSSTHEICTAGSWKKFKVPLIDETRKNTKERMAKHREEKTRLAISTKIEGHITYENSTREKKVDASIADRGSTTGSEKKTTAPKTAEEKRVARDKKARYREKKKASAPTADIDGSIGSEKKTTAPKTAEEKRVAKEYIAQYREKKKASAVLLKFLYNISHS